MEIEYKCSACGSTAPSGKPSCDCGKAITANISGTLKGKGGLTNARV